MIKKRGSRGTRLKLPRKEVVLVTASFWKRILAFLIDLLIIQFIILGPFDSIFEAVLGGEGSYEAVTSYLESNPSILAELSWVISFIGLMAVIYFVVLQYKYKQSVGMMLFNTRVHSDFKELKVWQLVVSNLILLPIFPFVLLWIIDPVYSIFSDSGQRLSQKLAGINIVEEQEVGYLP